MHYYNYQLTDFNGEQQQLLCDAGTRFFTWGYEIALEENGHGDAIECTELNSADNYDDARYKAQKKARAILRDYAAEGGEPFARSLWIRVFCYIDKPLFFAECTEADAVNKGVYDLTRQNDVTTAYCSLSRVVCLAYGQDDAERLAMALLPQDEEEEGENERIAAEMVRRESYSDIIIYDDWEEIENDD